MHVAGDEDFYYFTAAAAGGYTLTLNNWIGIYNWGADYDRLWVYDKDQAIVGPDPCNWMMGNNVPMTINIPAAGKYYIRLHCGNASSLGGYTFNLASPNTGIATRARFP